MKEKLRKLLNYIFTITQIILLFGVNITCFAADPLMQYTYKFSYEKGQGDYYIGTVFAPKSFGYYVGYTKYTVDENGNEGYYTISTQSKVTNNKNIGKVFVSSYYDKESNKSYTPLNSTNAAGTNYLGSEYRYIIDNKFSKHYFGGGYQEADLIIKAYNFKYNYNNGDYFLGEVRAREDYAYPIGYTKNIYSGGILVGSYKITALKNNDVDPASNGHVYVNKYYDIETKSQFQPTSFGKAVGTNFLGSEGDFIIKNDIPEYYFSGNYHEADQASYLYAFKYSYLDGDYYTGSMYASPGLNYYVGYNQTKPDEKGHLGIYEITAQKTGYDYQMDGKVYLSSYYDTETGQAYNPVHYDLAMGNNYLGSESDYVLNKPYSKEIVDIAAEIKEFRFGNYIINDQAVNCEADLADIYNVKDYGAKADGITDDSQAIQNTVDYTYAHGGGFIIFPSGVYSVISVNIKEGITYYGDGATIKRPAMQPKGTRTFNTQWQAYAAMVDSRPIVIRNLIFDGNSQNQGAYSAYQLEHSDLLFLMANGSMPGRLKVIVEDSTFQNSVSDGISVSTNVDIEITNVLAENDFRGGLVVTGGNSIINVNNLTTRGTIDATGIDFEPDSKGYGNTFNIVANINNINLVNGDFDLAVLEGSVITGDNIKSDSPFHLYAKDSKMTISNSEFAVGPNDMILYPNDVTFNNCIFSASEDKIAENNNTLYAAPQVHWNISGTSYQNQKLTFNDCTFTANANVESSDTVYGIITGIDPVAYNNVLTVNGGQFTDKLDVGLITMYRGANWRVNNATINANLAFFWNGYSPTGGGEYVNIVIDSAEINGSQFMLAGDYSPAGSNLNRLEIRNVYLPQSANYIMSPYGLRGTVYVGNRVVIGQTPPTDSTHGFVGDIYTDNISRWECNQAGYYDPYIYAVNFPSQWLIIQ